MPHITVPSATAHSFCSCSQIFVGDGDGGTHVHYTKGISVKGALLCANKAVRLEPRHTVGGGHCWTAVAIPNPNRSHADDFSGGVLVGWQVAKKSWDQSYTNSIAPDIKNPHALPMYKAESEKRMPRMKDR